MALIGFSRYQQLTADTTSDQSDVETAIEDAKRLIEERLRRELELDERTEYLQLVDGVVYPSATPVTVVPDGLWTDRTGVFGVSQAHGLGDLPGPFFDEDGSKVQLTYTGGYDAYTCPVAIQQALAQVAFNVLHTKAVQQDDSGEGKKKSVRLGDASVTYETTGATGLVPLLPSGVMKQIERYQRRVL